MRRNRLSIPSRKYTRENHIVDTLGVMESNLRYQSENLITRTILENLTKKYRYKVVAQDSRLRTLERKISNILKRAADDIKNLREFLLANPKGEYTDQYKRLLSKAASSLERIEEGDEFREYFMEFFDALIMDLAGKKEDFDEQVFRGVYYAIINQIDEEFKFNIADGLKKLNDKLSNVPNYYIYRHMLWTAEVLVVKALRVISYGLAELARDNLSKLDWFDKELKQKYKSIE